MRTPSIGRTDAGGAPEAYERFQVVASETRPVERCWRALMAAGSDPSLTEQDARGYALRSRCDGAGV